ncbi:hypothetical protein R1sor_003076 [Riccia sorocarpa]|uniref:Outer envelope pore protein 37, chloroplastic n=1 Tax=Riccia sorocarpa TaxID=122646 RepID=A0ABD3H6P4_9MARC
MVDSVATPAKPSTSSSVTASDNVHKHDWRKSIALKASTEYDSDLGFFVNRVSARVFDGLAKFKASFERGPKGEVGAPLFGFSSKYLSVLYDAEDQNAQVTVSKSWRNVGVKYVRDIKAEQGDLTLTANAFNDKYRAELRLDVPPTDGMPRGSVSFPFGEFKVFRVTGEDEEGEEFSQMQTSGFLAGSAFGGRVVADYKNDELQLRYAYKDDEMTLTPSVTLPFPYTDNPSLSPSVQFKRQFDEANKLSYLYNFSSTDWSAVYKHKPNDTFKLKLGYDSNVRLLWGSTWVGKEDAGAKQAPRKCRLQIMVQVPQDNVKSSVVLFRIKKRWDL